MTNFYAIANGYMITEDIYEGGILRYAKDSEPYSDLYRFSSKKERDDFVNESDDHHSITVSEIKQNRHYKEQFRLMNN